MDTRNATIPSLPLTDYTVSCLPASFPPPAGLTLCLICPSDRRPSPPRHREATMAPWERLGNNPICLLLYSWRLPHRKDPSTSGNVTPSNHLHLHMRLLKHGLEWLEGFYRLEWICRLARRNGLHRLNGLGGPCRLMRVNILHRLDDGLWGLDSLTGLHVLLQLGDDMLWPEW